ncbi:NAD(P)/FAD-dependent oxidoreductase, partial [Thermodesulfobacteriota bacterium]
KIIEAPIVENFPGFPEGISGPKLATQLLAQAMRWGVQTWRGEVLGIDLIGESKVIRTPDEEFPCRTLIIAGGAEHMRLDVPGEDELIGNGISFCALCDGPSLSGEKVAVTGAGDGGLSQALYLRQFTDHIIVIEKLPQPTASPALINQAVSDSNISFILSTVVNRIERVDDGILLHLRNTAEEKELEICVEGVIISKGLVPNTGYLRNVINLEEKQGWIIVDSEMRTNIPGIFAAGDVRAGSLRQAISAVADGATAVMSAFRMLKGGEYGKD